MTRVQGFKPEEVKRDEVVAVAFYIASKSTGHKIQVRLLFPEERELYALGRSSSGPARGPGTWGAPPAT